MENPIEILYFSSETCNVCKVLRPKVKELTQELNIKFNYIDIDKNPDKKGQYMIFSIPTILIEINGKEYKRFSRNISVMELKQNLIRYMELVK